MKTQILGAFLFFCGLMLMACDNGRLPEDNSNSALYDIPIEKLLQTKIIHDTGKLDVEPTFNLSIEDLMALQIVKEIRLDTVLALSYEIPLEDLLNVEIKAYKKDGRLQVSPGYEMSLNGLMEFEIQRSSTEIKNLTLSYDISLEGLMQIKIIKEK
jgi:hypothetical protein